MLLDHHQQAYSSAGFNATLRDLGRFGEKLLWMLCLALYQGPTLGRAVKE